MSRCRSVEKQDLHIKSLKLATTGLQLEFFIVYNWFMADFLVLFYYWNFFGLWLAWHWLSSTISLLFYLFYSWNLIGLWLVWVDFQVLFFFCFMHGLTHVFFLFYYIYPMNRGNPVILQGWVLNWSNLWFFKFRLFLSFL